MGKLFDAISRTIRGKRDEATKKLADPVRDGKFAIEDAEGQIREFRGVLTKLVAASKKLEREVAAAKVEIKKYDRLATTAGEDGNEAAVNQAVAKIEEWEAKKETAATQLKRNLGDEGKLRKQLSDAETKVSTAKSSMHMLAARKQGAEIRKQLSDASSKFGTSGKGLAALDDLREAVDEAEAEADAAEDLSSGGDEDLLEQYAGGGSAATSARASKYLKK